MSNSNFLSRLKEAIELTPLERAVKTSFNRPIPDLGDLIADYIDRKGDSYKMENLLNLFNNKEAKSAFTGQNSLFSTDEKLKENYTTMMEGITALVNKPQYLDKLKELTSANDKQGAGQMHYSIVGHKRSILDDISEEIEWLDPKKYLARRNYM